mmetsp:Transcript_17031/g.49841  ORF Transcript_17031/g.49841 Transcript_17031/m.49841 type:complete len:218 (+) Transcript_17031:1174-1827(+)
MSSPDSIAVRLRVMEAWFWSAGGSCSKMAVRVRVRSAPGCLGAAVCCAMPGAAAPSPSDSEGLSTPLGAALARALLAALGSKASQPSSNSSSSSSAVHGPTSCSFESGGRQASFVGLSFLGSSLSRTTTSTSAPGAGEPTEMFMAGEGGGASRTEVKGELPQAVRTSWPSGWAARAAKAAKSACQEAASPGSAWRCCSQEPTDGSMANAGAGLGAAS